MLAYSDAHPTQVWSQIGDDGTPVTLFSDPSMIVDSFVAIFYIDGPVEWVEEMKPYT
jgi:hypothetical protein